MSTEKFRRQRDEEYTLIRYLEGVTSPGVYGRNELSITVKEAKTLLRHINWLGGVEGNDRPTSIDPRLNKNVVLHDLPPSGHLGAQQSQIQHSPVRAENGIRLEAGWETVIEGNYVDGEGKSMDPVDIAIRSMERG